MIVIGLTGSFASGKSQAAAIFKKHGAEVFDADKSARVALQKGKPAYRAIVQLFGKEYLGKDGQIDRKKLAERVFNKPADLKKLNILIHPGVIFECLNVIGRYKSKDGLLILDVPLLFESKMENLADVTVLVKSGMSQILERAKKRGVSPALTKKILSTQWSLAKKSKLADFVINNNGSLKDLEEEIKNVITKILVVK